MLVIGRFDRLTGWAEMGNRTLSSRSRRGGLDFKPTPDCKGPRSGLPTAMEPKGGTLESGVKDKADRTVCGHS